jgi:hypothetical protein
MVAAPVRDAITPLSIQGLLWKRQSVDALALGTRLAA